MHAGEARGARNGIVFDQRIAGLLRQLGGTEDLCAGARNPGNFVLYGFK